MVADSSGDVSVDEDTTVIAVDCNVSLFHSFFAFLIFNSILLGQTIQPGKWLTLCSHWGRSKRRASKNEASVEVFK